MPDTPQPAPGGTVRLLSEVREAFLGHFEAAGHARVPSAPLVPLDDPTLLFVNAGMVPFKNLFTGREKTSSPRAASVQKCVRAGGKHNDLDNVGYTARHHTFFEMLGNFSFGDYFKEGAIELAWSLLTRGLGLDAGRLLVTVYHTDDEAHGLWKRIAGLPDERIIRIASDDNFWSMGDTGPCGPCSEIFWDHGAGVAGGPPGSAGAEGDRFVEIWNLVFMAFDQQADGRRVPLPRPSIDTGMGLERAAAVLQGVHDNYATDLFQALIGESAALTGTDAAAVSHRVIADHLRASAFLMADGVMPSNEGRGYVLRRIMRRAMRHAHLLGAADPLMHRLVPRLVGEMGAAWPELVRAQPLMMATLEDEETRFRETLSRGLHLLDEASAGLGRGGRLPGGVAFRLYDTYGFPLDLTEDALRPRGIAVDRQGFEAAMDEQRARARAAWAGSGGSAEDGRWLELADRHGATEFVGYAGLEAEAEVLALVGDGGEIGRAHGGDALWLVASQTPFYAESGGQVGDTGVLVADGARGTIADTARRAGRLHVHRLELAEGALAPGDRVRLVVDGARRDAIRAHHSATHLLHAALRRVLGGHVAQKGSLVAPDRLRFDFSHPRPMTPRQLETVEALVNEEIRANLPVGEQVLPQQQALAMGAMALFGEKYGDEVRVLSMGRPNGERSFSIELCGGTHARATGDLQLVHILAETGVAAGVRRIEALAGAAALGHLTTRERALRQLAADLRVQPAELGPRIAALVEERRRMERELAALRQQLALGGVGPAAPLGEEVGGVRFVARVAEGVEPRQLRGLVDQALEGHERAVAVVATSVEGRGSVTVGVSPGLVAEGVSAVELVRLAAESMGGKGGGGRADMAQAGGPEGARATEALDAVRRALAGRTAAGVAA